MDYQKIELYFRNFSERIQQAVAELPEIAGNEAINFALDNFEKESFEGKPWQKRKSKKDAGRKLLVKSGRLRRSPRIIRSTPTSVMVGSDVPYARVHNDGLTINRATRSETFVRARFDRGKRKGQFKRGTSSGQGFSFSSYSYQMPKRTFLAASPTLKKRIVQAANEHIKEALKK